MINKLNNYRYTVDEPLYTNENIFNDDFIN